MDRVVGYQTMANSTTVMGGDKLFQVELVKVQPLYHFKHLN